VRALVADARTVHGSVGSSPTRAFSRSALAGASRTRRSLPSAEKFRGDLSYADDTLTGKAQSDNLPPVLWMETTGYHSSISCGRHL